MNAETIYEVITKLVGPIDPIAESREDDRRFENLKVMISIFDKIHSDLDDLEFEHKNKPEFSRKRAAEYVSCYFDKIGIKND